VVAALSTRITE
jgi:hypothetical protein